MGPLSPTERTAEGRTEPLNVRVDRDDTAIARQVAEALRKGPFRYGRFMKAAVHVGVLVQAAIDALSGGPEQIGPWTTREELAQAITPIVTALIEFQMKNGVTPAIIWTLQSLVKQPSGAAIPQALVGDTGAGTREEQTGTKLVAPVETVTTLRMMGAARHRRTDLALPTDIPAVQGDSQGK